jgi:hypothetical protein
MTEELKKLLDHVVEYATELLIETGESYPFAAYIDLKGNHHPLEMEIDPKHIPQIGKVIENLTNYCVEEMKEKRMRGYSLSYEVKIQLDEKTTTDAICFEFHHCEEKNLAKFFLPYTATKIETPKNEKREEGAAWRNVKLGHLFAVKQ